MELNLYDRLPIMGVEHDCILSNQGDVTIVFKIELPEIFTLSDQEYENLHQSWIRAIKVLPKHSILHKQDWFLERKYQEIHKETRASSFLNKSSERHFKGRPYLDHESYVMLTKKPKGRKLSSSLFSNLLSKTIVPEENLTAFALEEFSEIAGQFKKILEDCGLIRISRLKTADLISYKKKTGLIERYLTLSENEESVLFKDISFDDGLQIADQHAQLFTLCDADDLPHLCGSRITYDKMSTDLTKFPISFACPVGMLLSCNHIYNQYVFIGDAQDTLKKLESKRLRLQSLSAYSRENSIALDSTNDFLNEAIAKQHLPVRAHFNVLVWNEDKQVLKELKKQVYTAFSQMDSAAKPESVGAAQIWWAGTPGNAADFPMNDTFQTFAEQAVCFINQETGYRSDSPKDGIRFCDRLTGKPVFADLFKGPRRTGLSSNMGTLVCGSSGGGKSMTVNHILRTLYDQGAHCVTIDIGGSYKGLCELLGGYYFTYTEKEPIRFNPFYLSDGESLDTEKKESLKALLVSLWKEEQATFRRTEYVALSEALEGYYEYLNSNTDVFPCFNSFYEYLRDVFAGVHETYQLKDEAFDLRNFLYALKPFYANGEFDYLLNARENLDLLQQPFIVIELDNIKDHPILFGVVTLIICELFISKMRKLEGVTKVLTVDEAWKAIARSGMAEFLKYAFKTIRKFNGIPIVVTQEINDLVSSPIIKEAIINNADIKILMDMSGFMNKFDEIQETLGLSEKAKTILLSVKKENREIFIDIGGKVSKVFKNELCPEEYYSYTTEGTEKVKVAGYAARYGSVEKGIEQLIIDLNAYSGVRDTEQHP